MKKTENPKIEQFYLIIEVGILNMTRFSKKHHHRVLPNVEDIEVEDNDKLDKFFFSFPCRTEADQNKLPISLVKMSSLIKLRDKGPLLV